METLNLSIPIDFWDYNTNWTHTVTPSVAYSDVGLELFLKHNATDTYFLVGHPNITWYWNDLGGGIGMWWLDYQVDVNETADISDYFVVNEGLTGEYNDGMGVRWTGYFTNKTHMQNDPTKAGGTTTVWPWLAVVRDISGNNIDPRPEIYEKNTMTLAYKDAYVVASAKDSSGNIVSSGMQNEALTVDMDFYVPEDRINGTEQTTWDGTPLKIQHDFHNITIGLKGGLVWANATHINRAEIWYYVTYNALTGTWTNTTEVTINVYTLISNVKVDTIKLTGYAWEVTAFDLEIGSDLSHIQFNLTFSGEAPDMVFDDSKIVVGYNETVWYWSGDWILADSSTKLNEIKNNIVWSPRRFTLGPLPTYRPQAWVVTADGALDLDGNVWTTDDQYYIKRTAYWDDWGNQTVEGMYVNLIFDPSPGQPGDEFRSNTWMGVIKRIIEFQANETFYWYKAKDWSPVGESEMTEIRSMVWDDQDENLAHPDYAFVAWLSKNRTIDLSSIPELASGSWENTWFAWGTEQHFLVGISESQRTWAGFKAEYAGMLLFNDTNGNEAPDFSIVDRTVTTDEVTHVVLIDSVGNVTLRPAIDTDQVISQQRYPADAVIHFGITIQDVDLTLYPLRIQNSDGIRSPWDFRTSYEGLMGLNQSVFDYAISTASVTEMGFDIAFSVDLVEYDPEDETTWNHAASFKTNQTIGDWSLNNFDDSVLEGRGLAINYFGQLTTLTGARYEADSRPITDTNAGSETADYYTFGSETTPFANVSMGDLPYTSAADVPSHSVEWMSGSSTAPIGAFSLMYQSESGQTITRWNVESTMLFMTAGYTHWDGQEIICDPVFVAYTSSHNTGSGATTPITTGPSTTETPTTTPSTTPGEGNLGIYILVGGIVVVTVIVCVAVRRKQ
jgi:hypothetical protein